MTDRPAFPPDPALRIAARPRNLWTRLAAVTAALAAGDPARAQAIWDGVRHHPDLSPAVAGLFGDMLAQARADRGGPLPVDRPADWLENRDNWFRPAFRRLDAGRVVPKPYPWGMALPGFAGRANETGFLDAAATQAPAPGQDSAPLRLLVLWTPPDSGPDSGPDSASDAAPDSARDAAALLADLAAQRGTGPLALTVGLCGAADLRPAAVFCPVVSLPPLLSAAAAAALAPHLAGADAVLFLSGRVRPDPFALARVARILRVSDRAVVALHPQAPGETAETCTTPFTPLPEAFGGRFPFREVSGLNLAVPARLLGEIGLPDARFAAGEAAGEGSGMAGLALAARELAYRAWVRGAWFVPVAVPGLAGFTAAPAPALTELYKALAPNHWDRKRDAWHEVPKVSVYIPAWNASKYIARAIDSVLEQDFADLDICIANDGSTDGTLDLLQARYGSEPRVRWTDNANGGIGFASNSAIRMSRSLYVGQLDSDDCLKPGAVRRLAEFLDDHPSVVCAYGSCERIDAAGNVTMKEYSWPVFSREKMMITSIAHHFRMFRRQAWERTARFREDIVNGVDYDIFLKLSEVGEFRHIDEVLYQRRWHGENTSHVNEHHQTANTHRVQREALQRQGLSRFWDVHVPDPDKPRNVTYKRKDGTPVVVFWPDYSAGNPYQSLLYAPLGARAEVVSGDIAAAIRLIESGSARAADTVFHLHWLHALFRGARSPEEAQTRADGFLAALGRFRDLGGRVVWTIHNTLGHDSAFAAIETDLSARIAALAHRIHLHAAGSLAEVQAVFSLPADRVTILRHGHYIGAYPDSIDRAGARAALGIGADEDVILFTGLVRPYKGVDLLAQAFRDLLADRPQALLLIAGHVWADPLAGLDLTPADRARIRVTGRYVADAELQVFCRAADIAAYPYRQGLTSGSLPLALGFGLPVLVSRNAMTAGLLAAGDGPDVAEETADAAQDRTTGQTGLQPAGWLHDPAAGAAGIAAGLRGLLAEKDAGRLGAMAEAARRLAACQDWPDPMALFATDPSA